MLTERNIRVPEDVSVISIDDSDLARHSEVPITSLPHPKENLGKKAAETLLQMIAGRKKDLTYEFDTRVVERESVAECTENGICWRGKNHISECTLSKGYWSACTKSTAGIIIWKCNKRKALGGVV